ncbi:MAG: HAD family hydrolase [Dehalococcoidia bacterium]|nr:HAD family hydrolase [Dehalococcoidia bacterium]MDD5494715.1 HAD family hydrolase [Dehalococcoidia bacterium]
MNNKNKRIEVVSFDVEGTIVTTDFSYAIWFEMIPQRFALRHGLEFDQAMLKVRQAYESVGDQRLEWYDVQYWFTRFDLGRADIAMEELQPRVKYFPETAEVLKTLGKGYKLNVASGSPRHFLKHLLRDIEHNFSSVYSSISDFQQVKTADFYADMCCKLGVEPRQVVHVGDNLHFDYTEPASIGINAFHLDREGKTDNPAALRDLTQIIDLLGSL